MRSAAWLTRMMPMKMEHFAYRIPFSAARRCQIAECFIANTIPLRNSTPTVSLICGEPLSMRMSWAPIGMCKMLGRKISRVGFVTICHAILMHGHIGMVWNSATSIIVRCLSMALRYLSYFRPFPPYVRAAVCTLQLQVLAYLLALISMNHCKDTILKQKVTLSLTLSFFSFQVLSQIFEEKKW